MNTKTCNKCKQEKHLDDFHKSSRSKDGRQSRCKPCACTSSKEYHIRNKKVNNERQRIYAKTHAADRAQYHKRWYKENAEEVKAAVRAWKSANKTHLKERYYRRRLSDVPADTTKTCTGCHEVKPIQHYGPGDGTYGRASRCISCIRLYAKAWREKNKDKVKARSKANYEKRKDYYKERFKVYRLQNWESLKKARNAWRRENGKNSEYSQKRRALKLAAFRAPVDWVALQKQYQYCCAYCGARAKLTMDHVVPLSRGGWHGPDNVVPACLPCNSKKYTSTLEELGWTIRMPG